MPSATTTRLLKSNNLNNKKEATTTTTTTTTTKHCDIACRVVGDEENENSRSRRSTTTVLGARGLGKGTTLLTIGQDLFSIHEYLTEQYNFSLHEYLAFSQQEQEELKTSTTPATTTARKSSSRQMTMPIPNMADALPAAMMVYTDLQTGLWTPIDYGSGIEYATGLLQVYQQLQQQLQLQLQQPTAGGGGMLQIGWWLGGADGCRNVLSGVLDAQLQKLLDYLILFPNGQQPDEDPSRTAPSSPPLLRHTFLRVGYEFDNPGFGYSSDPAAYRRAFRYIVQYCHDHYSPVQCQAKISFVWHSWAATEYNSTTSKDKNNDNNTYTSSLSSSPTLQDFYPGDAYVDWIGVSIFGQFYSHSEVGNPNTLATILEFAKQRNQHKYIPVMIAESTPFGGIDGLNDPWNDWFVPVLNWIQDTDKNDGLIQQWCYINSNWRVQPMWRNTNFGDTRLSINTTIMKLWNEYVRNVNNHKNKKHQHQHHRFVHHTDLLDAVAAEAAAAEACHCHDDNKNNIKTRAASLRSSVAAVAVSWTASLSSSSSSLWSPTNDWLASIGIATPPAAADGHGNSSNSTNSSTTTPASYQDLGRMLLLVGILSIVLALICCYCYCFASDDDDNNDIDDNNGVAGADPSSYTALTEDESESILVGMEPGRNGGGYGSVLTEGDSSALHPVSTGMDDFQTDADDTNEN